jgi:hypothetical protein
LQYVQGQNSDKTPKCPIYSIALGATGVPFKRSTKLRVLVLSLAETGATLGLSNSPRKNSEVGDVISNASSDVVAPVALKAYTRFALGEGIEKAADDFAAEVAKVSGVA